MFNKKVEETAIEHAKLDFPNESVGVVVDNEYMPCKNIHQDPINDFLVAEKELLKIGIENIQAVIHSHPFRQEKCPRLYPSELDMKTQIAFNVPFGIICSDKERAGTIQWFGDGVPKVPLIGRGFIHGIQDCYSLIRDYYKQELNIQLLEFPRTWDWWNQPDVNLYVKGFSKTGFREISLSQMKEGDVFLMPLGLSAMRESIPCHGGIYLGNDEILHHKCGGIAYDMGRVSAKENAYRYTKYFTHVLRHKERD